MPKFNKIYTVERGLMKIMCTSDYDSAFEKYRSLVEKDGNSLICLKETRVLEYTESFAQTMSDLKYLIQKDMKNERY